MSRNCRHSFSPSASRDYVLGIQIYARIVFGVLGATDILYPDDIKSSDFIYANVAIYVLFREVSRTLR